MYYVPQVENVWNAGVAQNEVIVAAFFQKQLRFKMS